MNIPMFTSGVFQSIVPEHQYQSQQTRDNDPMFDQCWPTVYDVGPTFVKHWVDVSCFLGYNYAADQLTTFYAIFTH